MHAIRTPQRFIDIGGALDGVQVSTAAAVALVAFQPTAIACREAVASKKASGARQCRAVSQVKKRRHKPQYCGAVSSY